jgi:hypothetical protein
LVLAFARQTTPLPLIHYSGIGGLSKYYINGLKKAVDGSEVPKEKSATTLFYGVS